MAKEIVNTFYNWDRSRRVVIFRDAMGRFRSQEEYFHRNEREGDVIWEGVGDASSGLILLRDPRDR